MNITAAPNHLTFFAYFLGAVLVLFLIAVAVTRK